MATPLAALGLGMLAGLFASLVLSVLVRLAPSMRDLTKRGSRAAERWYQGPNPFDPESVRRWQERSRSPAAYGSSRGGPAASPELPERALVVFPGPGPEGSAEQFAVKVGAGLFDRDIKRHSTLAGKVVHFAYGSLWGGLYGLIESSAGFAWAIAGSVYGAFVWLIGPAFLVPAMRVMLWPKQLGARRTLLLIAGHVVYGCVLAGAFLLLWRRLG